LDQGLSFNNAKLEMPINLQSGERKSFKINLGVYISNEIKNLILEKYNFGVKISYIELINYLAINGTDLYGDKVRPFIENGKVVGIASQDFDNIPYFSFRVNTAKKINLVKPLVINLFSSNNASNLGTEFLN
jgi:hypothetical protein